MDVFATCLTNVAFNCFLACFFPCTVIHVSDIWLLMGWKDMTCLFHWYLYAKILHQINLKLHHLVWQTELRNFSSAANKNRELIFTIVSLWHYID